MRSLPFSPNQDANFIDYEEWLTERDFAPREADVALVETLWAWTEVKRQDSTGLVNGLKPNRTGSDRSAVPNFFSEPGAGLELWAWLESSPRCRHLRLDRIGCYTVMVVLDGHVGVGVARTWYQAIASATLHALLLAEHADRLEVSTEKKLGDDFDLNNGD